MDTKTKMTTQEKASELVQDLGINHAIYVTEEVMTILKDWEGTELAQKDWVEIEEIIRSIDGKVILGDKQERIEEACKRIKKELQYAEFDYTSFKLGFKWQQERSCSKEDIIDFLKSVFQQDGFDYEKAFQDWQATKIQ